MKISLAFSLLFAVSATFSANAQEEQITPFSLRVQNVDDEGIGFWIDMKGYKELGSPCLSHDGQWLAFDAYKAGFDHSTSECWMWKREGGELRKLANGATPRWSPDAKRLLFMRELANDRTREPGVFLIDQDGKNEKKLLDGRWPDWSPDGRKLVYSLGGRKGRFGGTRVLARTWIADLDGSNRKELCDGDCPSWSPDGLRIATCHQDPAVPAPYIRLSDLTGDEQSILGLGWHRANWTKDGEHVVCNGYLQGGREPKMLKLPTKRGQAGPIYEGYESARAPCYSRDGKWIAFIAERPK